MAEGIGVHNYGTEYAGTTVNRPVKAPQGELYWNSDLNRLEVSKGSGGGFYGSVLDQDRVQLVWVAGARGKPGINADILSTTESVRMITDPDFEILGTNGSSDDVTFNAEGGLTLTTDGADGDGVIILPHLDANQSAWTQYTWGSDQETYWKCKIKTGTAAQIDNAIIWAGLKLTNTPTTATDADQVFFRYENDVIAGDWQAVYSIGDTDTATDTNLAVAAATTYTLEIAIDSARLARMWINGTLYATSTALTDTTDFIPYIGVEADGAAEAKVLYVYGQEISRNLA
jgi:hypothetical protein